MDNQSLMWNIKLVEPAWKIRINMPLQYVNTLPEHGARYGQTKQYTEA